MHPNKYTQGLRYYPFAVNLDRCVGSCRTFGDLSNRVCVLNKTEDLSLNLFNIVTGINESQKYCKYKSSINVSLMVENITRIKHAMTINVGVSAKIQKNLMCTKKIIF